MKKASVFSMVLALAVISWAAPVFEMRGLLLEEGGIPAVRQTGKTIFLEDFASDKGLWTANTNYENKLVFERKDHNGKPALVISNPQEKISDTAWEITSKPVTNLANGKKLAVLITAAGDVDMIANRHHKNLYHTAIKWLDAKGEALPEYLFAFESKSNTPVESAIYADIPKDAAGAVIRIGADSPNINPRQVLAFHRVEVQLLTEQTSYLPEGSFLSGMHPVIFGDMISWNADCPKGTSVMFQLSQADSTDDMPNTWTPYAGPDGTDKSFYTTSGTGIKLQPGTRWVRYKAVLKTTAGSTPRLKSVTIGSKTDSNFEKPDYFPPRLLQVTPARSKDARVPVVFRVTSDSFVKWKTLKVAVDGKDVTSAVTRDGDTVTYIPTADFVPLPELPNPPDLSKPFPDRPVVNLHSCSVYVEDMYGKILDSAFYFTIGDTPKGNVVTIRDDGFTLVDGKPFFPIGLYAVWKREFNEFNFDKCFADLKANGFNTVHTYNSARTEDFTQFMDKAHEYGMKLYIASRRSANHLIIPNVLVDVIRERNHPAMLAWYLADDTSGHCTWGKLQALSSAVRAIDPNRITIQADGVGSFYSSNYRDYVDATDGFLPELYPIKDADGMPGVPKIIADMKTIRRDLEKKGNPTRTIWAIVQYFDGWSWVRFPTFAELRAMTYLSIIHGAHGMTWYTYGGYNKNHGVTSTPETWKNITTVSKELASLQDVLTTRNAKAQPAVQILAGPKQDAMGFDSISCLLKDNDGKKILLTANSSKEPVKAKILIPGVKKASVLFEDRKIDANGAVEDDFAPFAVHVYELEK